MVLVGCGVPAASTASTTSTGASTTEQTSAANNSPAAGSADATNEATAFPSWNANSELLKALVDYVNNVTDESSPNYVVPEDRIATFDMDGTIICEKAPYYVDYCMLLNRVLDNPSYNEPEYKPSEEPIAIAREIGKRPILAFGNSSGDYSMLNYAKSNPKHKGMGVLVLCDDTEREYGDMERAKEQTETAQKEGWTLFHMCKDDWNTIYGEGVKKTELPGASATSTEQPAASAASTELAAAA